jgi:hypothetical protein
MPSARIARLTLALLCASPVAATATELDPEKVARIRLEEKAELKKIADAHGNKKPGEMDNAERREVIQKQQAASQAVLEKHGVSTRDWANYTARMSREEQAGARAGEKKLEAEAAEKEKKAAAAAAAAAKKDANKGGIPIQQGISESNPVEMDATPGAPPRVEEGLPAD